MKLRKKTRKAIILMMALAAVGVMVFKNPKGLIVLPKITFMTSQQSATFSVTSRNSTVTSSEAATLPASSRTSPKNTFRSTAHTCRFNNVDAFDPEIVKMVETFPPLNCSKERPWLVYKDGHFLKVNVSKVNENGKAANFSHCSYRTLTKGTKNDNQCIYGEWSKHFNDTISIKDCNALFIETECYSKSKQVISNSYFSNIVLNHETRNDSHISRYINHLKRFAPKETLSVLLVGIDGLSKQNCQRSMPKTRKFLLKDLGGVELQKYNKVGLNTLPNMMPMLTGHHFDFYETHLNWMPMKMPFDKIGDHFVWKEFGKAGYRTALDLEEKQTTAFHFMKRGFNQSPVDYYTRPMVLALQKKKLESEGAYCRGDKPAVSVHLDFLHELATGFNSSTSPYFAFSFMTRLTHDDQNRASSGDDLYFSFLKTLRDRMLLNNTVLIFFSDHGERFGTIRRTYNGNIESKSPAGFIVLPEWFKSKYVTEFNTLKTNADRLVSVFDIHATLRDLLYFKSPSPPANLFPEPGISLFQKIIPETRTCQDAGIPQEYCNCNSIKKVTLDKEISKIVSSAVTDSMLKDLGSLTKDKCHKIVPKSIESVLEQERPRDRIKDIMSEDSILYHITIVTTPGKGVFEAVVDFNNKSMKAAVVGLISRLNLYKGEKGCIRDAMLRRFCYCK